MMRIRGLLYGVAALTAMSVSGGTAAQPSDLPIPAATTSEYPAGIGVRETADGAVYVDAKGRTLYGLDMRTVHRWAVEPAMYCVDRCDPAWQPLLAPKGTTPNIGTDKGFGELLRRGLAGEKVPQRRRGGDEASKVLDDGTIFWLNPQKAPDWTVIEGPSGPQYVYKGWHLVYVREGEKPGSAAFDGADNFTWNTLKFIPPQPQVETPPNIAPVVLDGSYALADMDGRLLYTGDCRADCADWQPMAGGLANRGVGDWAIARGGDLPQWTWRGKPVFVSPGEDPASIPAGGEVLRP